MRRKLRGLKLMIKTSGEALRLKVLKENKSRHSSRKASLSIVVRILPRSK
jgi:hypothetical protein